MDDDDVEIKEEASDDDDEAYYPNPTPTKAYLRRNPGSCFDSSFINPAAARLNLNEVFASNLHAPTTRAYKSSVNKNSSIETTDAHRLDTVK